MHATNSAGDKQHAPSRHSLPAHHSRSMLLGCKLQSIRLRASSLGAHEAGRRAGRAPDAGRLRAHSARAAAAAGHPAACSCIGRCPFGLAAHCVDPCLWDWTPALACRCPATGCFMHQILPGRLSAVPGVVHTGTLLPFTHEWHIVGRGPGIGSRMVEPEGHVSTACTQAARSRSRSATSAYTRR